MLCVTSVDKKRARELFSEISPQIKVESLTCDDRLVYNFVEFYNTLKEVTLQTFTAEEKRQHLDTLFFLNYVDNMDSPAQAGPLIKILLEMNLTVSQSATITHAYSTALKAISGDDRSFSFSVSEGTLVRDIGKLAKNSSEDSTKRKLLDALRIYLVKHLTSSRCLNSNIQQTSLPFYILYANGELFVENPISEKEAQPFEQQHFAAVHLYWQSAEAKQLLIRVKKLRYGNNQTPLTNDERTSPDWQLELNAFLNQLSQWNGSQGESEEDYFHQRGVLYESVLDLAPQGPSYDKILLEYANFLKDSSVQQSSRIDWFWHINNLFRRIQRTEVSGRIKQLEILSNSAVKTLRLYAKLKLLELPK